MRWLTTAVLAVLLAGLATFYYVYEIRQAPGREKAAAVKDHLWKDLEGKDVEEIVVRKGDAETLRLKRAGGTWSLTAPVSATADARAADDLASSLATLRVEREIEANPQKPADFGLAPPAVEVTFKAKGQDHTVRLGAKSPSGVWAYAQEGGKPAVLLVPEGLLKDAQKPPSEFRDRTLLAFERKDVKTVEVRGPAGQVVVAAGVKGADEWQLTAPLATGADREAITALLEKLRAAKIKEFVTDAPKNPAEYGLDRPTRITLGVGEEASRTARTLRFGKAVPDKKGVYAQREGDGAVLLAEDELAKAVPASPMALRDKTVFVYDRGKLERVELESPKGKVALALQDGKWRITAPVTLAGRRGRHEPGPLQGAGPPGPGVRGGGRQATRRLRPRQAPDPPQRLGEGGQGAQDPAPGSRPREGSRLRDRARSGRLRSGGGRRGGAPGPGAGRDRPP